MNEELIINYSEGRGKERRKQLHRPRDNKSQVHLDVKSRSQFKELHQ